MKKRQNPYGLPFLIPIGIGLGVGLLGWGAGAVYLELQAGKYQPSTEKAYKHTVSLMQAIEKGEEDKWLERNASIPSVLQPPTSIGMAEAKIAYWSARAAALTKDPVYMQIAKKYLDGLAERVDYDDLTNDEAIAETLRRGVSELNATEKAGDIQTFVFNLSSQADERVIAGEKVSQDIITPDSTDFLYENLQDTVKPFTVVTSLWTGKKPPFLDSKTWLLLRVGVYGTLGLASIALALSYKKRIESAFKRKRYR